jgi:CHAT domain-containing protein
LSQYSSFSGGDVEIPLVLSGLVLAGANLPRTRDRFGITEGDRGILTAEAVAGLPLQGLELAVLSACDTGPGQVAGGEGIFGLQRAFHMGGARNVVASLWKVDDQATAALMRLFYYKLWTEGKPPIVALRESQLAVYRHPEKLADLATTRGPEFTRVIQRVSSSDRPKSQKTAPTKAWAGFVLSGIGR